MNPQKRGQLFEKISAFIFKNNIFILIAFLIVVISLMFQLPKTRIDTTTEGFLHENDPALITYHQFRKQFGLDDRIVITLKPVEIFQKKFLNQLRHIHEDLVDNVPHVAKITSLINIRLVYGKGDTLIVRELLEDEPETEQELRDLKHLVMETPTYQNTVISEDGKVTAIMIELENYSDQEVERDNLNDVQQGGTHSEFFDGENEFITEGEKREALNKVKQIIEKYRSSDLGISIGGGIVLTDASRSAMQRDMPMLSGIAIVGIGLVSLILFRRLLGVILPLLVVGLTLMSTLALMALFGIPIKVPTQILPTLLTSIGVGGAIHFLVIFLNSYSSKDAKSQAMAEAFKHSGLPIMLTSLTTAGGLISFTSAKMAPVADLGYFAAAGVLFSLIYTLLLLPAILATIPIKPGIRKAVKANKWNLLDHFLTWCAVISTSYPKRILAGTLILLILGGVGATRLEFSHNTVSWFSKSSDVRIDAETIDHQLEGSMTMEVLLDSGKENGLYNPELLSDLEKSKEYAKNLQDYKSGLKVGQAISIVDILKEVHQGLSSCL